MEGVEEGASAISGGKVAVVGADVAAVGVVETAGLEVAIVGEEAEACAGHATVEAALGAGMPAGMAAGVGVGAGARADGSRFAGGGGGMAGGVAFVGGKEGGGVLAAGLEAFEDAGLAGDVDGEGAFGVEVEDLVEGGEGLFVGGALVGDGGGAADGDEEEVVNAGGALGFGEVAGRLGGRRRGRRGRFGRHRECRGRRRGWGRRGRRC